MSGFEKTQKEAEEEVATFCGIAQNGNMVGQRGGTFVARQAIFLEQQRKETSHNPHIFCIGETG